MLHLILVNPALSPLELTKAITFAMSRLGSEVRKDTTSPCLGTINATHNRVEIQDVLA